MSKLRIALIAVFGLGLLPAPASATSFTYADFSSVAGLQLNGSAAQSGNRLRLTPSAPSLAGSAFSTLGVGLSASYSFSTFFSFQITANGGIGDGDGQGADGLTFIVQTVSNTAGGGGGGIGYQGIAQSIAIEYDTFNNGEINGNHVGLDVNGSVNSINSVAVAPRLNDGNIWYSWVDYNGATDTLEVRLSQVNIRPILATLTQTGFDLQSYILNTNAFVGFSAGTGAGFGNHDILSWVFVDEFAPIQTGAVPEPGTLVLMGLGGLAIASRFARRRK